MSIPAHRCCLCHFIGVRLLLSGAWVREWVSALALWSHVRLSETKQQCTSQITTLIASQAGDLSLCRKKDLTWSALLGRMPSGATDAHVTSS